LPRRRRLAYRRGVGIRVELSQVGRIGRDLVRCEGVMVARDGAVWAADGRGACTPTNICFGGPDRRTAYIGNLTGPSLQTFRLPYPGMALVHQQ
jgi:hypothetical protein